MNLIEFVKLFLPPIFTEILRSLIRTRYGWHGDFSSWEEAKKLTIGYDNEKILKKVKEALLKVKNGEAIYERDSVLFDHIEYSWPLLSGLLLVASMHKGRLSVLDFGGSLGSSYFQNRKFLNLVKEVSWNIVEQSHFVEEGRRHFQDNRLHFYETVEECVKKERPDVVLFSSVLCYLEKPYEMLKQILSYNFDFIIVDRTPFHTKGYDRITIQKVPPWIYEASYPCWIFDKNVFVSFFEESGYFLVEEFESLIGKTKDYEEKGFIWKKKA